ncbi:MAG: FecR domain-containing protein [Gammaproteobacteria bacterium]|nr:FecR domain-containing protein [Gammaproteobacteria bacterium]
MSGHDRADWRDVQLNQVLCAGQQVRLMAKSRAVLRLPNETLLRLDEGSVVTLQPVAPEKPAWLEFLRGAVHIISRVPRALNIRTPFVNAGIEGTEFALQVGNAETALWVYEGRVLFENAKGQLRVGGGEAALARAGRRPERRIVVKPRQAVEWALYYPPLLDSRSESYPEALRPAVLAYRRNDLTAAFAALDGVPEGARNARYHTLGAGLLLSVGRVPEAEGHLRSAERLDPKNGTAYALRSVIALVRDQKDDALGLAETGAGLDPNSPLPEAALSYAHQGRFEIEKALEHAKRAVELAPEDALLWARLSELELSRGDLDAALEAAQKAETLSPALARTQTVLGFVYLTRIEVDKAKMAFERAIQGDPADPLPRLGLGLAKIRDGDLDDGAREIETAASLDPNNSLVRSYLGKAYYEQKRDGLASSEYEQAKLLDPKDPTPWFYDAIEKQTTNRPVEALHDLQRAIELNDNRAVYRSKLLLDEDLAARSANLARIYDDLGFQQRARVEAWKSVTADPASFSAHRFLADSYSTLQRHEIARVSELLQSQLLQPLNITPLQPELAVANLAILQGAGPSSLSFYEYNPLFTRNGAGLQTNVLVGNNDTVADNFVVSGIHRQFSGSVGQFHYETDGFRPNNDLENDVYNAFGQVTVTPELSLQAELRRSEQEAGDVDITLNELDPSFRQEIKQDSARIGAHYQPTDDHDLLASFIYSDSEFITDQNFDDSGDSVDDIAFHSADPIEGYSAEIQHLFRGEGFKAISGIGYSRLRNRALAIESALPGGEILSSQDSVDRPEDIHGYAYVPISLGTTATLTLGASYDSFHTGHLDTHPLNPKFGLVWNILPSTTLRAAAFRVLKRFFVTNQTLEPTQLAGFNQFFDDLDGTDSTRYGFGLDQRFSPDLYGGFELSWRDLTRTLTDTDGNGIGENQDERFYRSYLHWAPHPRLALAAEYQFEEFERESFLSGGEREFSGLPELRTHYLPLDLSYFHPSGLSATLGATYVDQEATRTDLSRSHERFWTLDASIGYRLPKRYGLVSLDVRNLFDEEFDYQNSFNAEAQQQLPRFQPSRAVFLRINLWSF